MNKAEKYYDKKYWEEYQGPTAEAAGVLEKFKFERLIEETDTVLDFGCGGGYILANLACEKKMGVEINDYARAVAEKNSIECYRDLDEVTAESVDIIISNHTLEHTLHPASIIKKMHNVLKRSGKAICVVPCEQVHEPHFPYKSKNKSQHLFNWTPMTLGNLFNVCGFSILSADIIVHQFAPNYEARYKDPLFHQECIDKAIANKNLQVCVVAEK